MPAFWTSPEQRTWLQAKVGLFLDARSRHRTIRFVKGVHAEFSREWPERDALFPATDGEPRLELTDAQKEELSEFTAKRFKVDLSPQIRLLADFHR